MIIKCPECKHDVSTKAPFCPNCGYEISDTSTEPKGLPPTLSSSFEHRSKKHSSAWKYVFLMLFLIILAVVLIIAFLPREDISSNETVAENESETQAAESSTSGTANDSSSSSFQDNSKTSNDTGNTILYKPELKNSDVKLGEVLSIKPKRESLGQYEFTFQKTSFSSTLYTPDGKWYYNAGDNMKYLVVDVTVKNTDTESHVFYSSLYDDLMLREDDEKMISYYEANLITKAVVIYDDTYKYTPQDLPSLKSAVTDMYLEPLQRKNGQLIFKLPIEAIQSDRSLSLEFICCGSKYILNLRQ